MEGGRLAGTVGRESASELGLTLSLARRFLDPPDADVREEEDEAAGTL